MDPMGTKAKIFAILVPAFFLPKEYQNRKHVLWVLGIHRVPSMPILSHILLYSIRFHCLFPNYMIQKLKIQTELISMIILLMAEIPNNHLGCIKPCKSWDTVPTSTGLLPSRVPISGSSNLGQTYLQFQRFHLAKSAPAKWCCLGEH